MESEQEEMMPTPSFEKLRQTGMTESVSDSVHISTTFTIAEFRCKCGCGICHVEPRLLEALEELRELVQQPIGIRSGCRCRSHNQKVGGQRNSEHLTLSTPPRACRAADIHVEGVQAPLLYRNFVTRVPTFLGIGLDAKRDYVHVDVRLINPWRWKYNEKGKAIPWT
jgi:hypothetical protein